MTSPTLFAGSHLDWLRHERERAAVRARWAEWFESWDVLLSPVTPTPAIPHDQEGDFFSRTIERQRRASPYLDNIAWTGLIGIVGLPSAVPPLGPTASGLPVGCRWWRRTCATAPRCGSPGSSRRPSTAPGTECPGVLASPATTDQLRYSIRRRARASRRWILFGVAWRCPRASGAGARLDPYAAGARPASRRPWPLPGAPTPAKDHFPRLGR